MLALLRQRNFALLWFGGLISLTGDWVLHAALPFYIYQQTHSTLATAARFRLNRRHDCCRGVAWTNREGDSSGAGS